MVTDWAELSAAIVLSPPPFHVGKGYWSTAPDGSTELAFGGVLSADGSFVALKNEWVSAEFAAEGGGGGVGAGVGETEVGGGVWRLRNGALRLPSGVFRAPDGTLRLPTLPDEPWTPPAPTGAGLPGFRLPEVRLDGAS